MSPDPVPYRLSDAERDEATSALGDAFAEGRLEQEEFEVRLAEASRARFATDLDPLFADLPRRRRGTAVAKVRTPAQRRRPPLLLPFAVLLVLLLVVGHMWLLVPLAFVAIHGFGPRSHPYRSWGRQCYAAGNGWGAESDRAHRTTRR